MSEQLNAPNAVLPVKWVISLCKQGWVGPRASPDMYEKQKTSCPHRGSNQTAQPVAKPSTLSPLPATEGAGMSMAHSRGKIMKITLHKDLYDTTSKFVF